MSNSCDDNNYTTGTFVVMSFHVYYLMVFLILVGSTSSEGQKGFFVFRAEVSHMLS